jgi:hypothetical protein
LLHGLDDRHSRTNTQSYPDTSFQSSAPLSHQVAVFGGAVTSGTSSSLEPLAGKPFFPKASEVKLVRPRYPFGPGVACQLANLPDS